MSQLLHKKKHQILNFEEFAIFHDLRYAQLTKIPSFVIYTNKKEKFPQLLKLILDSFKDEHPNCENGSVLGFDVEFYQKNVATIQLSTNQLSIIFQVSNLRELPKELDQYLRDKSHFKCGVGISGGGKQGDDFALKNTFGTEMQGSFDVAEVSFRNGITNGFYIDYLLV
jgi:hypothetical protein